MHKCIYLFAGGQGQAILLLKPPELVQPGLREARGDEGRGDTTTTGAMSGPSGLMHEVVVGERRIIDETRDLGVVRSGQVFQYGQFSRDEERRGDNDQNQVMSSSSWSDIRYNSFIIL